MEFVGLVWGRYLRVARSSEVRALLRYHDFSRWFLPLKGEAFRHKLNRSVEVSFGSRKEAFTWLS